MSGHIESASSSGGAALLLINIVAARERAGHPISMADAQIAAICRNWSAGLATRNDDFMTPGVDAINPWDSATPYCPARETAAAPAKHCAQLKTS